jgi:CRP/FNR family transcriptional regulator
MPFAVESLKTLEEARARPAPASSPCGACPVRHLTVCAVLDPGELHDLTAIVSNVDLSPGQPLFDECEPANHVFNVTAGAIKIYKLLPDGRRQITGFLFAGDFLGLRGRDPRHLVPLSPAQAGEPLGPLSQDGEPAARHGQQRAGHRPGADAASGPQDRPGKRLLGMASNELVIAQEQMLLLGRKTAREKLASFLLMLSKRQVQRGGSGDPVSVPITRADIGDYLGLTTETVSRTFTQLKRKGVIAILPGGRVELADRSAMEETAEGF